MSFKISIVTVSHNSVATIERTLRSIAEQSYADVEHIIVDGASTDGTLGIVESHAIPGTIVVSEPDNGIYDAMQKGLVLATGQLCCFLNSDDYFSGPNVLSKVAEAAVQKWPVSGVLGVTAQIDGNGEVRRLIGARPPQPWHLRFGKFPPHPSTFLATQLMREVGGFDTSFRLAGDFDLFLRVSQASKLPLVHLEDVLVKMSLGGASTSGIASYKEIGREMMRALAKTGPWSHPGLIRLRILLKLPELQWR